MKGTIGGGRCTPPSRIACAVSMLAFHHLWLYTFVGGGLFKRPRQTCNPTRLFNFKPFFRWWQNRLPTAPWFRSSSFPTRQNGRCCRGNDSLPPCRVGAPCVTASRSVLIVFHKQKIKRVQNSTLLVSLACACSCSSRSCSRRSRTLQKHSHSPSGSSNAGRRCVIIATTACLYPHALPLVRSSMFTVPLLTHLVG